MSTGMTNPYVSGACEHLSRRLAMVPGPMGASEPMTTKWSIAPVFVQHIRSVQPAQHGYPPQGYLRASTAAAWKVTVPGNGVSLGSSPEVVVRVRSLPVSTSLALQP